MITVIVPVMNEEDNLESLLAEIDAASKTTPISEIIYVDDGSTDNSFALLQSLRDRYAALRVIRHDRRAGQSAALWTGIKAAGNTLIATLDGDGQNDPADIALVYKAYQDALPIHGEKVMVAGQRKKRQDSLVKRLSSRIANKIRSGLLKDGTRDTGCALKFFRRRDYLDLPYFNHMHRFLPALMIREGAAIVHVDVSHRPRTKGASKYGTIDRLMVGITDLLGVRWLQTRGPAHVHAVEEITETPAMLKKSA